MLRLVEQQEKVIHYATKRELLNMKPFIRKETCDCNKQRELCRVKMGECPCGEFKEHKHCSSCGSILIEEKEEI